MLGLMQDWPLLCHRIIDHAAIQHAGPAGRVALGRGADPHHELRRGPRARAARWRSGSTATASGSATASRRSAWNTWRHIEAWYGIIGIGAIYHTVNPRLFPEQIVWIVNHAEDRVMIDRPDVRAAAGEARRQAAEHRALCRAHRRRAHAGDHAEERGALRGMDRRGRRRFRLEKLRREHRRRHVLHLRHHRQSQGRALLAPLQRAARLHGVAAGRQEHRGARRGAAGRADVPRQLLVAGVLDAADGRLAGPARRQARRRPRSTSCSTNTR